MTRLEKQFDVPIPLQDVEAQWNRVKARHHAEVRFLPIDEQHTRVHVAGDEADVDRAAGDLRGSGLSGAAGGTFGGGTGGTPGAGGRHPGTT